MLDKLTSGDFAPYLNQIFRIAVSEAEAIDSELIGVSDIGQPAEGGRRQSFSLVFRVAADANFPQKIYTVEHEAMGAMDLFLVPIGPDESGMRYEAVFT